MFTFFPLKKLLTKNCILKIKPIYSIPKQDSTVQSNQKNYLKLSSILYKIYLKDIIEYWVKYFFIQQIPFHNSTS